MATSTSTRFFRRLHFESAIGLFIAMTITVSCLFAATRWALHQYFGGREILWREEVAQEKERNRALQEQRGARRRDALAEGRSGGMRLLSAGTLEQVSSGLLWTERDNGADISWKGAREHCGGLQLGSVSWQLPTAAELLSLYEPQASNVVTCGAAACRVSALFELTSQFVWTSENAGNNSAWYVSLEHGNQFADSIRLPSYYRALCVHRP